MNTYVAFTFGSVEQAAEARGVLRDLENRNKLALYDAVELAKDDNGQVTRRRDPSGAPVIGAMVGATLGLALVFALPVIGVLIGAGAGALLAALLFERRIDEDYIADAGGDLSPGASALLCLISSGDLVTMGSGLRPFDPQVYESTLSPQLQATLLRAAE